MGWPRWTTECSHVGSSSLAPVFFSRDPRLRVPAVAARVPESTLAGQASRGFASQRATANGTALLSRQEESIGNRDRGSQVPCVVHATWLASTSILGVQMHALGLASRVCGLEFRLSHCSSDLKSGVRGFPVEAWLRMVSELSNATRACGQLDSAADKPVAGVHANAKVAAPDNRLARLRVMLLPPDLRVADSSTQQQAEGAFNLDELRALVFRGVQSATPERNLSIADSTDTTTSPFHLRPLAWRVLLGILTDDPQTWPDQLRRRRADYHAWKRQFLGGSASQHLGGGIRTEEEHRRDELLLKEIQKDVSRTRSDLSFFAGGGIAQQQMLYILFVYAKQNSDVGYIQGMNEILAPILFACGSDPVESWSREAEADAFACFTAVLASLKVLYGRSPHDPLKSGADTQMGRLAQLLRQHDAILWQHLNSLGLTPDLYSFRWYMTLLGREFPMVATLRVWDALLADPRKFSFLHYVSCALVRSQRTQLLRSDFTAGLQRLQALHTAGNVDVEYVLQEGERMRDRDRGVDEARRRQGPSPSCEV